MSSTAAAPEVAGAIAAHTSAAAAAGPTQNVILSRIWAATVAHRKAEVAPVPVEDLSSPPIAKGGPASGNQYDNRPRRWLAVGTPSGGRMPTFIMLSTLTPDGVQTLRNNPTRIREVNQELEQLGATVKAQWATLGHYDFVNVVEAPDEKTMARVSLELGSRGTGKWETMVAIPIDDFIATL